MEVIALVKFWPLDVSRAVTMRKKCLYIACAMVILFLVTPFALAQSPSISSGLNWLTSAQNADGSWGGDSSTTDSVPATSAVIEAFTVLNNSSSQNYMNAASWLTEQQINTTRYLAERLSIFPTSNADKYTILLYLDELSRAWGGYDDFTVNSLDTSLALQALKAANYSDTTVISQALGYLTAGQNADGGWGFVSGHESNVYVTAIALRTLSAYISTFDIQSSVQKATTYLRTKQNLDGGFGSSPSTVYETALAYMALAGLITDNTVLGNSINYLTAAQSADGSWNQDPYNTALALQALHLAESKPTPPPAPTMGTVSGTVIDGSTNQPLNGVSIILATDPSLIVLTNSTGSFNLTNVPAGSYQISFSSTGYSIYTGSITISAGSIVNLGAISLSAIPTTGIIQGTIADASTGSPLTGVTITVTGTSTWTATTAANGSFKIIDIVPGNVTISASKAGYYTAQGTGVMTAGGTLVFSPTLSTLPATVTTGGLKGIIVDSSTSLPVQGATITITPDPSGIGPVTSSASGSFSISGIDPGNYTVSIASANYISQIYTATIIAGTTTDLGIIALAASPSTSTTITGTVMNSSTGQLITGADVFIVGTSTTVKTDSSGAYTITGITQPDFDLKASSEGYDSLIYHISLNSHGTYAVNFALTSSQASDLKIISLTTDKQNYSAYTPVSIAVNVQNISTFKVTGAVSISIMDAQGKVVDYLQATTVDADGAVQNRFDFQPGNTTAITIPWETKDLPPGAYSTVAKIITGEAGTGGGAAVVAEKATPFSIDPTQAIASLVVAPLPRFTNLGAAEQINLLATLANRSNVATELGIAYEWRSPSGLILHSGIATISLLPAESSKAVTLEAFPFTFTESGEHPVYLSIVSGPTPASSTGGVVSVAPGVRIEPSQSIVPATVVPDGDKRIRMQIRLKGVEQK